MRIRYSHPNDDDRFGEFLGVVYPDKDGDTVQAVIRLDNHGLILKVVHPSCVTPVTPEEDRPSQDH